jgi:hypothetical protein
MRSCSWKNIREAERQCREMTRTRRSSNRRHRKRSKAVERWNIKGRLGRRNGWRTIVAEFEEGEWRRLDILMPLKRLDRFWVKGARSLTSIKNQRESWILLWARPLIPQETNIDMRTSYVLATTSNPRRLCGRTNRLSPEFESNHITESSWIYLVTARGFRWILHSVKNLA